MTLSIRQPVVSGPPSSLIDYRTYPINDQISLAMGESPTAAPSEEASLGQPVGGGAHGKVYTNPDRPGFVTKGYHPNIVQTGVPSQPAESTMSFLMSGPTLTPSVLFANASLNSPSTKVQLPPASFEEAHQAPTTPIESLLSQLAAGQEIPFDYNRLEDILKELNHFACVRHVTNDPILRLLIQYSKHLQGCYFAAKIDQRGLVKPTSFFIHLTEKESYQLCVVMPKIEGVTLSALDPQVRSLENIVDMMLQSARILQGVGDLGYAHTDIKPKNMMFGNGQIVIIDPDGIVPIDEWSWVNTPGFAPPEAQSPEEVDGVKQRRGVSSTNDVFSLGMTFVDLLGAGRLKVKSDNTVKDYDRQIGAMLERIKDKYPNDALSALLSGMLMVNPDERWSFKQVIEQLEEIQRSLVEARTTNRAA